MNHSEPKPKINLAKKTMTVIEYMSQSKRGLSLKAIARGVGLPNATAHRIMSALIDMGYIEQDEDGEFYLTYRLLSVAGRVVERDGFLDRLLPILNYFNRTTECGISLTALTKDGVIALARVEGPKRFRGPLVVPGAVVPLYCSAVGKLHLSELPDEELEEYLERAVLLPYTENTITDAGRLREDILKTRRQGYGVINGEFTENESVLSIPAEQKNGRTINAINFCIHSSRFDEICNEAFIEKVKNVLKEYLNKE